MADFNQSPADGQLAITFSSFAVGVASNGALGTWQLTVYSFTPEGGSLEARIGSPVQRLDDLTDVIITSPVALDRLEYDGTFWRNAAP